jgi:hypothetical protein
MFSFTKSITHPVTFTAGGSGEPQTINLQFKWLPASARLAAIQAHDAALPNLPEGDVAAIAGNQADCLLKLAEGWDLKYGDGTPVPWERESLAQVLDYLPGLFGVILMASREVQSVRAVEKN